MDNQLTTYQTSPFDAIRQIDDQGQEYWSLRDLQSPLGYTRWENSEEMVQRAMIACKTNGHEVRDHFREATKMVAVGSGAQREVKDFHLTKLGCYLIAMNGDPRKPEIAAAQNYFAVQTMWAQTMQKQLVAPPEPLPLQGEGDMMEAIANPEKRRMLLLGLKLIDDGYSAVDQALHGKKHKEQKTLPEPKPKPDLESLILRHLSQRGPLSVAVLQASYLKKRTPFEIEAALRSLIQSGIVQCRQTSHSKLYEMAVQTQDA